MEAIMHRFHSVLTRRGGLLFACIQASLISYLNFILLFIFSFSFHVIHDMVSIVHGKNFRVQNVRVLFKFKYKLTRVRDKSEFVHSWTRVWDRVAQLYYYYSTVIVILIVIAIIIIIIYNTICSLCVCV